MTKKAMIDEMFEAGYWRIDNAGTKSSCMHDTKDFIARCYERYLKAKEKKS